MNRKIMESIADLIFGIDSRIRMLILIFILILQIFVLFFPKDLFMMYVGFIYGVIGGTFINFVSFIGMTLLAYEIGRKGKLTEIENPDNPKIIKFNFWLSKYGVKALTAIRLIPIIPTNVVSYGSGLAEFDRKNYIIVSIVTSIPWAFIWAYVGFNYLTVVLDYLPSYIKPDIILLGFLLFLLISIIITVFRHFQMKKKQSVKIN